MSDSYTYINPSSIIFQVAKKLNIKTILLNQENVRLFKKKKDFNKIYKSLDQINLNESASSKEVNNYLSKRFKGTVKEVLFKKSFYKKTKVKKNFIKKFFHLQILIIEKKYYSVLMLLPTQLKQKENLYLWIILNFFSQLNKCQK